MQVITLAASPGMLTRIDVVEPPYCDPNHTPVNMMSPVSGPIPTVNGSMKVIVAAGPTPGSTPTIVPRKEPTKQASRFVTVSRLRKPCSNWSVASMGLAQQPARQVEVQQAIEQNVGCEGGTRGQCQRLQPSLETEQLGQRQDRCKGHHNVTQRGHGQNPCGEYHNDSGKRPERILFQDEFRVASSANDGFHDHDGRRNDYHQSGEKGKQPRARQGEAAEAQLNGTRDCDDAADQYQATEQHLANKGPSPVHIGCR